MAAPLLAMRDIDKRFQGVQALSAASLEVAPAEIMALVGQNGAGKSTLIKVLTGAYRAGRAARSRSTARRSTSPRRRRRSAAASARSTRRSTSFPSAR